MIKEFFLLVAIGIILSIIGSVVMFVVTKNSITVLGSFTGYLAGSLLCITVMTIVKLIRDRDER